MVKSMLFSESLKNFAAFFLFIVIFLDNLNSSSCPSSLQPYWGVELFHRELSFKIFLFFRQYLIRKYLLQFFFHFLVFPFDILGEKFNDVMINFSWFIWIRFVTVFHSNCPNLFMDFDFLKRFLMIRYFSYFSLSFGLSSIYDLFVEIATRII